MALPYQPVNEVQSTLAAEYIHGTHAAITLTSAAGFPTGGGYVRVGIADAVHWCLLSYTGVSTNDLTGIALCTLGNVETEAAYTYPVGTVVFRDVAAEDVAERVMGPATAVDGRVAVFDSTTGKLIKDSGVTLGAGTSGGVPYYSAAGVLGSSGALTQYGPVLGGGAGGTPTVATPSTTTTHAFFATANTPAFRAIAAGDLPAALAPTSVAITPTPADHAFSGVIISANVGENVNYGELLYFDCSEVEWKRADYNAEGTMPCTGISVSTAQVTDGNACSIMLMGFIRHGAWTWAVTDAANTKTLYVGATGAMQVAPVSGTGDYSQAVGIVLTAETIYFNPSIAMAKVT